MNGFLHFLPFLSFLHFFFAILHHFRINCTTCEKRRANKGIKSFNPRKKKSKTEETSKFAKNAHKIIKNNIHRKTIRKYEKTGKQEIKIANLLKLFLLCGMCGTNENKWEN